MKINELMSVNEFITLLDDSVDRELIQGRLQERPRRFHTPAHGVTAANLGYLLKNWEGSRPRPRPCVHGLGAGFLLRRDPDTLIGSDLSIASAERHRLPDGPSPPARPPGRLFQRLPGTLGRPLFARLPRRGGRDLRRLNTLPLAEDSIVRSDNSIVGARLPSRIAMKLIPGVDLQYLRAGIERQRSAIGGWLGRWRFSRSQQSIY